MSNGNVAMEAQKQEINAAIEDIKAAPAGSTCPSHGAMARGMVTLLRVKGAEIEATQAGQREQRGVVVAIIMSICKWAVVTGIAAVIAGHFAGK